MLYFAIVLGVKLYLNYIHVTSASWWPSETGRPKISKNIPSWNHRVFYRSFPHNRWSMVVAAKQQETLHGLGVRWKIAWGGKNALRLTAADGDGKRWTLWKKYLDMLNVNCHQYIHMIWKYNIHIYILYENTYFWSQRKCHGFHSSIVKLRPCWSSSLLLNQGSKGCAAGRVRTWAACSVIFMRKIPRKWELLTYRKYQTCETMQDLARYIDYIVYRWKGDEKGMNI